MRKATTKKRKRLFYNKLTNTIFREVNEFWVSDGKELISLKQVEANLKEIYQDISLFPAHVNKNYGKVTTPVTNQICWLKQNNKFYLVYIVKRQTLHVFYKKVLPDGKLSKKVFDSDFTDVTFFETKENYKVDIKIRLL
jgi:hypothetical protein